MSDEQQLINQEAFHEKFIKGVNLRLAWGVIAMVIVAVFYGTQFLDSQRDNTAQIADLKLFVHELSIKVDTVRQQQMINTYNNKLQFQDIHHQIETIKHK